MPQGITQDFFFPGDNRAVSLHVQRIGAAGNSAGRRRKGLKLINSSSYLNLSII